MQADRQIGIARHKVGAYARRLSHHLDPVKPREDLFPEDTQLHLGDAVAHAAMDTKPERNMMAGALTVDAEGGHVFHGHVDGFSPGTGSEFALLPPENATGNFTKIVQRVPVRISLDGGDPAIGTLRAGLSAEVTVATGAAR